jgi:hypothetical protein
VSPVSTMSGVGGKYSNTIRPKETNRLIPNPQAGQKYENPATSGAQLRGFNSLRRWAIVRPRLSLLGNTGVEVGKKAKKGKMGPKKSRNCQKSLKIAGNLKNQPRQIRTFKASDRIRKSK